MPSYLRRKKKDGTVQHEASTTPSWCFPPTLSSEAAGSPYRPVKMEQVDTFNQWRPAKISSVFTDVVLVANPYKYGEQNKKNCPTHFPLLPMYCVPTSFAVSTTSTMWNNKARGCTEEKTTTQTRSPPWCHPAVVPGNLPRCTPVWPRRARPFPLSRREMTPK